MKQRFAVYVVKLIAQHVLMQNRWSDTRLFADSTPANFLEQASRARKRKEEGREGKRSGCYLVPFSCSPTSTI